MIQTTRVERIFLFSVRVIPALRDGSSHGGGQGKAKGQLEMFGVI